MNKINTLVFSDTIKPYSPTGWYDSWFSGIYPHPKLQLIHNSAI